jgi:tetratricopeptide (TPR) repeat protein
MNRQAKLISPVLFPVLFAVLASFAMARPAQAEPKGKQSAESHYNKGMTAYNLGHFQEAIEEFEKAYEIRSEPIFLYNIAQSHRQSGNPQRAIFFYRRYVDADPSSKKRAEVEKRIADMQAELDAQKEREAAATTPPATVVAPPMATQPLPAPVPQPTLAERKPPTVADSSQGRGLRIGGIVAAGVGVAGAVTGVVLILHGNSLHDESIAAGSQFDSSKFDSAKTFRTMGWVAVGVGAAAVATGVTLYILGARASSEPSVSIAPIVASGTGGAAVFGRF